MYQHLYCVWESVVVQLSAPKWKKGETYHDHSPLEVRYLKYNTEDYKDQRVKLLHETSKITKQKTLSVLVFIMYNQ